MVQAPNHPLAAVLTTDLEGPGWRQGDQVGGSGAGESGGAPMRAVGRAEMKGRRTEVAARPYEGEETGQQGQGHAAHIGTRAYGERGRGEASESKTGFTAGEASVVRFVPSPLLHARVCVCVRVCRGCKVSYYFAMLILRGLETKSHSGGSDQLKKLEIHSISVGLRLRTRSGLDTALGSWSKSSG